MFGIPARLRALIHHRYPIRAAAGYALALTVVLILSTASPAFADTGEPRHLAANELPVVIENLRLQVMLLLAGIATLFLVLAGVYWATAGGDPAMVDKAKGALKNALVGYGLAVLAPVLLTIVQGVVGG